MLFQVQALSTVATELKLSVYTLINRTAKLLGGNHNTQIHNNSEEGLGLYAIIYYSII